MCRKVFRRPPSHLKGIAPNCSQRCNGLVRGERLRKHLLVFPEKLKWGPTRHAEHKARMTGASNPSWKGGVMTRGGKGNYVGPVYVRCPQDFLSMARKDGYVMEHRLVVAMAMGRCLTRTECVHHVDHNPRNNAVWNLMLFATNRDHKMFEGKGSPAPLWPA